MAMGPTLVIGHDSSLAICPVSPISRFPKPVTVAASSASVASATPGAFCVGYNPAAASCESAVGRSCNDRFGTLHMASESDTSVWG